MTNWIASVSREMHGSNNESGIIAHNDAADALEKIGFKRLVYPRIDRHSFLNESIEDRRKRFRIITAGVSPGDTVIMQYPLWMLKPLIMAIDAEREFIAALREIGDVKIGALVWDITTWIRGGIEEDGRGYGALLFLNEFDSVISANQKMAKRMREEGIVKPIIPMQFTDIFYSGYVNSKKFIKRLNMVAGNINFDVINNYQAKTEFHLIGKTNVPIEEWNNYDNVKFFGSKPQAELFTFFEGGFGVVSYDQAWGNTASSWTYGKYNNPMKLSLYLAVGIPPIIPSDFAHAELIKQYNIGLVIDDFSKIDEVLGNMTEEEYSQLLENIEPWSKAIRGGHFTQRACLEAIAVMRAKISESVVENADNI